MSKNILGAHISIAGGVANSIIEAKKIGYDVVQIFTKNSNQWSAKSFNIEDVEKFKNSVKASNIIVFAHDSYLINIASPNPYLYKKSIDALKIEMSRCDELEIKYLVMHPGSHVGGGEDVGVKNITNALNEVLNKKKYKVKILLETTAGQGTNIGSSFQQLADIRKKVKNKGKIGFCLDTCHIFAAGYDLRTKQLYDKTIAEFDKILGLKNLDLIHINDSKKDFLSKVDRHEHIGKGFLGENAFKFILKDKKLLHVPKILETPKDNDMRINDLKILKKLEK